MPIFLGAGKLIAILIALPFFLAALIGFVIGAIIARR